jgi:mannose-6-phosphate isomerase-like protein (cupin superfamily)
MLDAVAADPVLTREQARARLIRRQDFVPCKVAFIDCKTPGSHLKENYSMIGPGVTTSPDQVVNLREPHGFNIGAAAMPRGITNNLHVHFTAEVFVVFDGDYTFRWGPKGGHGEWTARDGDILSVPTWIFRGFTNVGPDDGMVFTVLGGDDTGGIIWDPDIIRDAARYGLYLRKDGVLVDTGTGAAKPDDAELITPIGEADARSFQHWTPERMLAERVAPFAQRRFAEDALLDSCLPGHASAIARVIGWGISEQRDGCPPIRQPHGFSIEWLRIAPGAVVGPFRIAEKMVLLNRSPGVEVTLNRGETGVALRMDRRDILSVPSLVWRSLRNTGTAPAELLVIAAGDQRKRIEWDAGLVAEALAHDRGRDHDGWIAPAHLLPAASALLKV